jgi:AcrR family transcriptional regulator
VAEAAVAPEGLRERKKRETRQRISDIATGLFLERGFDEVTVAEVAKAADVAVNTVYNYFPSKEDLLLDEAEERRERLARMVRERRAGESAVRAILRTLREEIERREPRIGLSANFHRFLRLVESSPTLSVCMHRIAFEMSERLATALAEAAGTAEDDELPKLIAWQVVWLQASLFKEIGQRALAGDAVDDIAASALHRLDLMEGLLSDTVLEYGLRSA